MNGYQILSNAFSVSIKTIMWIFIPLSVNVAYLINWFKNIELSLHPVNKSHLIIVYDPFNVLLDSVW